MTPPDARPAETTRIAPGLPNALPRRTARMAALGALVLTLAGCQDYFARRDTISFHAGDAVAANRAVHVIDPWPAAAADNSIPVDGRKAVQAIEHYQTRGNGGGAAAAQGFVPMVPMTPGGAPTAQ